MKQRVFWSIIACMAASSGIGYAHHSFAATYDDRRSIQIEGSIVQVLFRNPHSFVTVDDKNGVRWGIEWGGVSQLFTRGVNRDTLKTGDQVVITATPGREPEDHRALMKALRRPSDGFAWGNLPGQTFE